MNPEINSGATSARIVWFLTGFLSIGSQTVLLRAGLVSFSGAEIVVGFMFFAWTIWVGTGSLVGGKRRAGDDVRKIHLLFSIALLLLPATYFAIYLAKTILRTPPAISIAPTTAFVFFAITLAPLCLCLGACFSTGCRLTWDDPGQAVAGTYVWEALGAGAGGVAAGGVILPMFSGANGVFIVDAVSAAALFFDSWKRDRKSYAFLSVCLLVFGVSVGSIVSGVSDSLKNIAWRGYSIVAERDSRYAGMMISKREGQYTMFVAGAPVSSYPPSPSDETLAYLAISLKPDAERVLLIGGGAAVGSKLLDGKNIRQIDYCEIDPAAIEIEKLAPSPFWRNPKMNLRIEDGRSRVGNSDRVYDLILSNVGDPATLAQNGYFTKEFFALAKRAMRENGVLVFGAGEYANYVGEDRALFLNTILNTLRDEFTNVGIFPIDKFYIGASVKTPIPQNSGELIESFDKTGLTGKYFYADKIKFDLSPDRYDAINKALNNQKEIYINSDVRPLGYTFYTNMRLSVFNEEILSKWIKRILSPFSPIIFIFAALALETALFRKRAIHDVTGALLFTAGFAGMAIEIIVLYIIQIKVGALYGYISVIITIYMIGLSVGGLLSKIINNKIRVAYAAIIVTSLLLMIIINTSADMNKSLLLIILSIITLSCSVSGGYIFGATAFAVSGRKRDAGEIGGGLNFADLAGGAAAALVFPLLAIPAWGLNWAIVIILLTTTAPVLAIKDKPQS